MRMYAVHERSAAGLCDIEIDSPSEVRPNTMPRMPDHGNPANKQQIKQISAHNYKT